jgi:hypothetical protein
VQQQIIAQLPATTSSKLRPIRAALQPRTVTTLKAIPVPSNPPTVVKRADPALVKLDAERVRLICQAFKGNVPGLKSFCH